MKLSWEARRSVRPRVCASVRVRLEPSAAFRHSEPGLSSARGSPGGRGADARALRCCVVSARRVAGAATLWGLSPSPQAVRPDLGCGGTAWIRREESVRPIAGPPGLGLCKCVLRPQGSGCGREPSAVHPCPGGAGRAGGGRPGAEVGGTHLAEGRADYLLCADPQSWKPERGMVP